MFSFLILIALLLCKGEAIASQQGYEVIIGERGNPNCPSGYFHITNFDECRAASQSFEFGVNPSYLEPNPHRKYLAGCQIQWFKYYVVKSIFNSGTAYTEDDQGLIPYTQLLCKRGSCDAEQEGKSRVRYADSLALRPYDTCRGVTQHSACHPNGWLQWLPMLNGTHYQEYPENFRNTETCEEVDSTESNICGQYRISNTRLGVFDGLYTLSLAGSFGALQTQSYKSYGSWSRVTVRYDGEDNRTMEVTSQHFYNGCDQVDLRSNAHHIKIAMNEWGRTRACSPIRHPGTFECLKWFMGPGILNQTTIVVVAGHPTSVPKIMIDAVKTFYDLEVPGILPVTERQDFGPFDTECGFMPLLPKNIAINGSYSSTIWWNPEKFINRCDSRTREGELCQRNDWVGRSNYWRHTLLVNSRQSGHLFRKFCSQRDMVTPEVPLGECRWIPANTTECMLWAYDIQFSNRTFVGPYNMDEKPAPDFRYCQSITQENSLCLANGTLPVGPLLTLASAHEHTVWNIQNCGSFSVYKKSCNVVSLGLTESNHWTKSLEFFVIMIILGSFGAALLTYLLFLKCGQGEAENGKTLSQEQQASTTCIAEL